jgi:hypothetical protein
MLAREINHNFAMWGITANVRGYVYVAGFIAPTYQGRTRID